MLNNTKKENIDSNNKTLSGVIAIQFINLTVGNETFFNLDDLSTLFKSGVVNDYLI